MDTQDEQDMGVKRVGHLERDLLCFVDHTAIGIEPSTRRQSVTTDEHGVPD